VSHDKPILLVEDDMLDVKSVRRAFEQNRISNPLHAVGNGQEALDYLERRGRFAPPADAPRPSLILLDINMPVMNGLEFLETYKRNDAFRHIPAVMLTTSEEESDRVRSYRVGVAGYIVKPNRFEDFRKAMERFDRYWQMCKLP